jgi:hypothetical protein
VSGACGAVDADAYSYCKKKKFASVGGDYCGIYAVCAGCRDCSRTVDICCRRTLPDFGGGCDSCCEVAEDEEEKATRAGKASVSGPLAYKARRTKVLALQKDRVRFAPTQAA